MKKYGLYERFDIQLHGGEIGDVPLNSFIFMVEVDNPNDLEFTLTRNIGMGIVTTYTWKSPISKSVYTLCAPNGIAILQRRIRKKFLGKYFRNHLKRQITGCRFVQR